MSKQGESENLVKVGITQGDPNGVGMEVILKTFADNRMLQVCTPVIYGSMKVANFNKKAFNLNELHLSQVRDAANTSSKGINFFNVSDEEFKVEFGVSNEAAGKLALLSLEAAIKDLKEGKIDALVTGPINKQNIQSATFKFPGHTEYLAEKFQVKENLMLLVNDGLRVGTVTGHIALSKISGALNTNIIAEKARIFNKALIEDFGIRKPRLAILALNPHAGDNGLMGDEEARIINPAILKLKEEGILALGPYAGDGFFGSGNYKNFDGILSMYHDQGLIPFKALSFSSGVNYTAGLPVIRTSPDHGTGYDIAGKGIASESSLREAIYLACDAFKRRQEYKKLTENPLKIVALKKERG